VYSPHPKNGSKHDREKIIVYSSYSRDESNYGSSPSPKHRKESNYETVHAGQAGKLRAYSPHPGPEVAAKIPTQQYSNRKNLRQNINGWTTYSPKDKELFQNKTVNLDTTSTLRVVQPHDFAIVFPSNDGNVQTHNSYEKTEPEQFQHYAKIKKIYTVTIYEPQPRRVTHVPTREHRINYRSNGSPIRR